MPSYVRSGGADDDNDGGRDNGGDGGDGSTHVRLT